MWHRLGRETVTRAIFDPDPTALRDGLRLYDGAWWRARRSDPSLLGAIDEDLAHRLADVAPGDWGELAPELELRQSIAGARLEAARRRLDELAATLPAATRERLNHQLGRRGDEGDQPVDDGLDELRRSARRAELEELAAPLVAELRATVARANGPNRREQSWDSYSYRGYRQEEWGVTVPFAALPLAERAVAPVAAAERILALPEQRPLHAWDRPVPGRAYRRYWTRSKRFLVLVADVAARFWADGGARLLREVRAALRELSDEDRHAVELHLATLGFSDKDPATLAERVLGAADGDDLGARGELVLHALRSINGVTAERRAELLTEAARVARRTTAFVASNPFAAAVEALAAAEVADLEELIELVHRAVRLKFSDWEGWDRALQATARALTHLVVTHGTAILNRAVAELREFAPIFPSLEATCLLAGARGCDGREAVGLAREALATARALRPSAELLRAEVEAIARLHELGAEGTASELSTTVARARFTARGRAATVGLQACAALGARLDQGDGRLIAQSLELADLLLDAERRWLAFFAVGVAPAADQPVADGCARQMNRVCRRWLIRRPPMEALAPLAVHLASRLPGGLRHPAPATLCELAEGAASGALAGQQFCGRLMSLAEHLGSPPAVAGLIAAVDELPASWWRLPLLCLVADGTARWLESVAAAPRHRAGKDSRPVC